MREGTGSLVLPLLGRKGIRFSCLTTLLVRTAGTERAGSDRFRARGASPRSKMVLSGGQRGASHDSDTEDTTAPNALPSLNPSKLSATDACCTHPLPLAGTVSLLPGGLNCTDRQAEKLCPPNKGEEPSFPTQYGPIQRAGETRLALGSLRKRVKAAPPFKA